MKIVDLKAEHRGIYFVCLDDWSDEMKTGAKAKESWHEYMKDKGLRVKLALDDLGKVRGMIQYSPIEYCSARGKGLYYINCIWVHGHKQGMGNYQKKGMGKALLKAAEEDVKSMGYKGIVAWGLSLPVFMRASWFRKQGYKTVDKKGGLRLLWKPFSDDAEKPSFYNHQKQPELVDGKVTVTILNNGWCTAGNATILNAKKAASQFGDKVEVMEIMVRSPEAIEEWGSTDGIYIDDRQIVKGPPLKYEKIYRLIEKKAKGL